MLLETTWIRMKKKSIKSKRNVGTITWYATFKLPNHETNELYGKVNALKSEG